MRTRIHNVMLWASLTALACMSPSCSDANATVGNAPTTMTSELLVGTNLTGDCYTEEIVYICTGPNSKRYHKSSHCRGFKHCSGSIQAITVSKAQAINRTPCKWCYN